MRMRFTEALGAVVALAVTIAVLAIALVSLSGCSGATAGDADGWPESDEFEHIETGADRWSVHDTGEGTTATGRMHVVVDHSTGVQYLVTADGVCPLLDADGSPLLVAEAGDGR